MMSMDVSALDRMRRDNVLSRSILGGKTSPIRSGALRRQQSISAIQRHQALVNLGRTCLAKVGVELLASESNFLDEF